MADQSHGVSDIESLLETFDDFHDALVLEVRIFLKWWGYSAEVRICAPDIRSGRSPNGAPSRWHDVILTLEGCEEFALNQGRVSNTVIFAAWIERLDSEWWIVLDASHFDEHPLVADEVRRHSTFYFKCRSISYTVAPPSWPPPEHERGNGPEDGVA
jgi:hypothetical protein